MANINFYLKTGKTNKDGEKSIIMRITYGNKRTVIFLNRMVHPKFWSTSKQNVRPNNRREPDNNYEKINEAIKSYRDKAEDAIDNAFKKNLTLSDKYFKNWFSNQQSENPYQDNDFFSLFDIYLEAIKPGLAPNTIKGYTTVRNFLEKFETDLST